MVFTLLILILIRSICIFVFIFFLSQICNIFFKISKYLMCESGKSEKMRSDITRINLYCVKNTKKFNNCNLYWNSKQKL